MRSMPLAILLSAFASTALTQTPPDAGPTPPASVPELGVSVPQAPGSSSAWKQRFQFNRVGDSVLRLDGETGQVAVCGPRAVGWACQTLPEDRAALESEIARLQSENAALTKQLASRDGSPPKPPESVPPQVELKLPSKMEIERARAAIEQAWRRFVEMIENLHKDLRERDKG